jgi:hypothetical protein
MLVFVLKFVSLFMHVFIYMWLAEGYFLLIIFGLCIRLALVIFGLFAYTFISLLITIVDYNHWTVRHATTVVVLPALVLVSMYSIHHVLMYVHILNWKSTCTMNAYCVKILIYSNYHSNIWSGSKIFIEDDYIIC